MRRTLFLSLTAVAVLFVNAPAHAQLARVFREGAEALSKAVGRKSVGSAVREGSEAATKGLLVTLRKGVQTGGGAIAQRTATMAGVATARHGLAVAGPVIARFGDDGARALATLSKPAASRLSAMADELARNPKAHEWLEAIAKSGDKAVEWIWRRKASLAIAAGASAVVLSPDEFFRATGQIASTAISETAEHVVEPAITSTAENVAKPLISGAMGSVVLQSLLLVGTLLGGTACWQAAKRRAASLR